MDLAADEWIMLVLPWISPGWQRGPPDLQALGAPVAGDEERERGNDGEEEAKG
jgi:hypothetical protein